MDKFSFLANAKPEEVAHYQKLIDIVTQGNTKQIEGLYAVEFFKKSGLDINTLSSIWQMSSVLGQTYLSPPEFIIYCKYIAMHQTGIPMSYENLKGYNEHIPFPRFEGISVGPDQQNQQVPVQEAVQHQPTTQNLEENDDFDDFVDPENQEAQQVQEPPKELTEEEKRKLEEEERLKRLDLISSAFDEAFVEEPKEEKPQEESKQAESEPTIEENKVEQPQKVDNQPESSNSWANFGFSNQEQSAEPVQQDNTWQNSATRWGQPAQEVKNELSEDEDFDDFADPVDSPAPDHQPTKTPSLAPPKKEPKASPIASNDQNDPFADAFKEDPAMEKKQSSEGGFPSMFDQASTPRVDNDAKSDIRMSFPSQEMWSSNFGKDTEQPKEGENQESSGWNTGGFEFSAAQPQDVIHETPKEEDDDFKDIMNLKEDVQKEKNDSFDDFADPDTHENQEVVSAVETVKKEPTSSGFDKPNENAWGNFAFDNKNNNNEKKEDDASWANFSNQVSNEIKTDDHKAVEKNQDSSVDDPFKDAFSENISVKEPEKVNDEKEDSDFDDFVDPVNETPQDNTPAQSLPRFDEENVDWGDNNNSLFPSQDDQTDIKPIEIAKHKEFTEKELFSGFLKTVATDTSKNIPDMEESSSRVGSAVPSQPKRICVF